jgi:GDP-D-mannose dehydratase
MNNTYGTHVMLEAARMTGTIRRFINVSTDEVYGETSLGKEVGESTLMAAILIALQCPIMLCKHDCDCWAAGRNT